MSEPKYRLIPMQVPGLTQPILVPEEGLGLGRDPANQIVVASDRFPQVSAFHVRLSFEGEKLILKDLDSKNGTLVNGKKVERHELQKGELIQLGAYGPEFMLAEGDNVGDTLEIHTPPATVRGGDPRSSTIMRIKDALGIPQEAESIPEIIRSRNRRQLALVLTLLVVITAGAFVLVRLNDRSRQRDVQNLLAEVGRTRQATEEQSAQFSREREALEKERDELRDRLARSAEAEKVQREELEQKLSDAENRLDRIDGLEQERLQGRAEVKKVREAVVFLETRVTFKDTDTGRYWHAIVDPESGRPTRPNLEEEGSILQQVGNGSGFCVSPKGWIITNAHVARPDAMDGLLSRDLGVEPELTIDVVFTDRSERHRAEVREVIREEDGDDLALLKIEPFEGMPHLTGLDPGVSPPEPGSPIYLFGFPLGNFAPQEGETVRASIFSGILSRQVRNYLQVDAAIYPGNSGGPVVNENGQVIGIATGVQLLPEGGMFADAMGYAIPVASVARIWPPEDETP